MRLSCKTVFSAGCLMSNLFFGGVTNAQQVFLDPKTCLYGVKNQKGGEILFARYNQLGLSPNGLVYAVRNGKGNYWLLKQDKLQPLVYDTINPIGDSILLVGAQGLHGFVHLNGQGIVPLQYQKIQPLMQGFLTVNNNKHGFLSLNFEQVLPNVYDFISPIGENFLVQQDKTYKLISPKSQVLKTFQETEFLVDKTAQSGLFLACKGDDCSIFDQTGALLGVCNTRKLIFWGKNQLFVQKSELWYRFDPAKKQFEEAGYQEVVLADEQYFFYRRADAWFMGDVFAKNTPLAHLKNTPQPLGGGFYLEKSNQPAMRLYKIEPKTQTHTLVNQTVRYFEHKYLGYAEENKWGVLVREEKNGEIGYKTLIKPQYEQVSAMLRNSFKVQKSGVSSFVDMDNRPLPCMKEE